MPDGLAGTYVQMPRDAMLAVLRIEAARAGAVIVGEDLGNVPDGLRSALAESGVLGCQVAMFEPGRAAQGYPPATLASFGTHDLPTWSGWRAGRDIEARTKIGTLGKTEAEAARNSRQADAAKLIAQLRGTGPGGLHRFLAGAASRLIAVQAEDVLDVADQPNLPGTVDEYPNWRRPLPIPARALSEDPRMLETALIMRDAGR